MMQVDAGIVMGLLHLQQQTGSNGRKSANAHGSERQAGAAIVIWRWDDDCLNARSCAGSAFKHAARSCGGFCRPMRASLIVFVQAKI